MDKNDIKDSLKNVRYPKLNPAFVPVIVSPDELQFRSGPLSGPRYTIRDKDGDEAIAQLPSLLDGTNTIEEILDSFEDHQKQEIAQILHELLERNIVQSHINPSEKRKGVNGYLSLTQNVWAEQVKQLHERHLLVIGSGEASIQVADDFAKMGTQQIDLIPLSSMSFSTNQNSVNIQNKEFTVEDISSADIVVFISDSPPENKIHRLNELAHDSATPWIIGKINQLDGFIGPAFIPGRSPCYHCFQKRLEANITNNQSYKQYMDELSRMESITENIPAFQRLISSHLTIHALHLLVTNTCLLTGRLLHVNFLTMAMTANDVLRLPRCPVCGHSEQDHPEYQRFVSIDQLTEGDG